MNWQSTVVVAVILATLGLVLLRVAPRVRRRIAFIVPIPLAFLIYRWAAYRRAWGELAAACGLAVLALGLWWIVLGRRLPPPSEPAIRVWTKDDEP